MRRRLIQLLVLPGFSEYADNVLVGGDGASDLELRSRVWPLWTKVGESDAVAFVQFSRARGGGDVHKYLAPLLCSSTSEAGRAYDGFRSPDRCRGTVVVHIPEIRAHRHKDFVEARFPA